MTSDQHIQRQLRDAAAHIRTETSLSSNVRRRIKLRRVRMVATSLVVIAALGSGATYAIANLQPARENMGPAEEDRRSEATQLFADFGNGETVVIELDPVAGTVCYSARNVIATGRRPLTRIDIVQRQQERTPVVSFDWDDPAPEPAGCATDVNRDLMGRIIDLPHEYLLLLVRPGQGVEFSPLSRDSLNQSVVGCGLPVDFGPTYLPAGWSRKLQSGSGGGGTWKGVLGHYGNAAPAGTPAKAKGGFAELIAGERPYQQGNTERIRVLDRPATLGDIHEGYSVEFTQHGCDYFLIAFGISRGDLRRFAEGLRLPGEFVPAEPGDEPFGAIWPEDTAREANDVCNEAQAIEAWRTDAVRTAEEFGRQVLGWEPAAVVRRDEGRRVEVELRRSFQDEAAEAASPAVMVYMTEVFENCWSVGSVSRLPDRKPTGISISIRGRDVEVGFDDLGAHSVYFEMGHGSHTSSADGELADGRITWVLSYKPDQTGHFLFLFRDENGEVFSAAGGPLPAGNFAAG